MRFIFLLTITLLFSGCVTMLPQIKDEFLAGKTKEQEDVLFKIEDQIIEINKQKSGLEKKINISKQLIRVNEKEYPVLKDKISYHSEIQELYILNGNSAGIPQNTETIKKIEQEVKLNRLMNDFLSITKKYHQSALDLNYAELSVKVSELSYEKSKIAAAYIDAKTPKTDAAADPKKQKVEKKNPINVIDYQKQLEDRKKIMSDKKAENENLLVDLNNSEKKIKYEGFTINPEFILK